MSEHGLHSAVTRQTELVAQGTECLSIPRGFIMPGFIATATCLGFDRQVQRLEFEDPASHEGLLGAMQVPYVLFGEDNYPYQRVNEGSRYSPVIMLQNEDDVDRATGQTSSCIRQHCGDLPGLRTLYNVIGELHDNVRAHAEGAGFSTALIWNRYGREEVIEFALTDNGKGFLSECRRRGIADVRNHQQAISWCLKERNSTKDKQYDDFAQTMAPDAMGNPMAGVETKPWSNGNNHQGLGLAKLMSMVKSYNGILWIASGDAMLLSSPHVRNDETDATFQSVPEWRGVAIACRFKISELGKAHEEDPLSEDTESVLADILI